MIGCIVSGAKKKRDTMAMSIHKRQRKMNPPLRMPAQAWTLPSSLVLRMELRETNPKISASNPSRKLGGKQMNPVNGIGIMPPQNRRMVAMPRIRLMTECRFVEGVGAIGSFDSMRDLFESASRPLNLEDSKLQRLTFVLGYLFVLLEN
jgi:hypothetical protein